MNISCLSICLRFMCPNVGSMLFRYGVVAFAVLAVGCDSKAADSVRLNDGIPGPNNIIIKESFVLARPDIVTAGFNQMVDELCPNSTRVSQAEVEKMYARTVETYISGRNKTVIKKGFSVRGNEEPCNSLGQRIESVSTDKARMGIIVNKKPGKISVEITDFAKSETVDFAFNRALKAYPSRVKFWTDAKYSKKEKVFGHECGYQEGVPDAFCTLMPNPLVVAFRNLLVLKAPPHRPLPDCNKSVEEALQNVPLLLRSGKCIGDVVHTVDSFEMNAAMPVGIFEIPAYARDARPVVKVME